MRTLLLKADSAGALRATATGYGFRIVPAIPAPGDAAANVNARPGRMPVIVRRNGTEEPLTCFAEGHYFEERFKFLDIQGAESGDSYLVQVFEAPRELVLPSARAGRQGHVLVPAGTAVPTAVPALSTDGFPLRPYQRRLTTYFEGVLTTATLYVRKLDGTWFNTNETADPTGANPRYETREIAVPGDRAQWVAAAINMTMTVEAESEAL